MWVLGLKLLKKWRTLAIMAFYALVIISAILMYGCVTGTISTDHDLKAEIYGEQSAILYNISTEQEQMIEADRQLRTGCASIYGYGELPTVSRKLALGSVDGGYLDLGHIKIKSGRMPENEGEAAIEEYLSVMAGNVAVGDTLSIIVETGEKTYHVTGILYDYSGLWSTNGQEGTGLPDVIVAEPGIAVSNATLLCSERVKTLDRVAHLCEETGVERYAFNAQVYSGTTVAYSAILKTVLAVVFAVYAFACYMMITNISEVNAHGLTDRYRIMKAYGLKQRDLIKMLTAQQFLLSGFPLIVAVPVGYLLHCIVNGRVGAARITDTEMLIVTVGIATAICLGGWLQIHKTALQIRSSEAGVQIVNVQIDRVGFSSGQKFSTRIAYDQFTINRKKYLKCVMAVGCCIALFCVTSEFDRNNNVFSVIDYSLCAQPARSFRCDDGYIVIDTEDKCFRWDSLAEIRAMRGVNEVLATVDCIGCTLELGTSVSEYWQYYASRNSRGDYLVSDINICVLDEKDYESLRKRYSLINTGYDDLTGYAVLFLPEAEYEGMQSIRLSLKDASSGYHSAELPVYAEVHEAYAYEFLGEISVYDEPVIVLSQTTAYMIPDILFGYSSFDIDIYDGTDNLEEIETALKRLTSAIPNSEYSSTEQIRSELTRVLNVIRILAVVICTQLMVMSIITEVMLLWIRIQMQIRNYALMRVLGMTELTMMKSLLHETLLYSVLTIGTALILIILFSLLVWGDVTMLLSYLDEFVAASVVVLCVNCIATSMLGHQMIGKANDYSAFDVE